MLGASETPSGKGRKMDSITEAPTTFAERAVRISALCQEADRDAVQALLELGAQRALAPEGEAAEVSASAMTLARQVHGTFEPEVPEFGPGDEVARLGQKIGSVVDRYLDERGEWVYTISVQFGEIPCPERELTLAADVATT